MNEIKNFAFADGEIKSILIEKNIVKFVYQRWDDKQFVFIFTNSCYQLSNCAYQTIGSVTTEPLAKGVSKELDYALSAYEEHETPYLITFRESWDNKCVFAVVASAVEIICKENEVVSCEDLTDAEDFS
jgi:hypothetical protein